MMMKTIKTERLLIFIIDKDILETLGDYFRELDAGRIVIFDEYVNNYWGYDCFGNNYKPEELFKDEEDVEELVKKIKQPDNLRMKYSYIYIDGMEEEKVDEIINYCMELVSTVLERANDYL